MSKNVNEPDSLPTEDVDWKRVREQHRTGTDRDQAKRHEADIERLDKGIAEEKGGHRVDRSRRR